MDNKKKILYVDDEELNLTLFKITFASEMDVLLAGSPQEALIKLEENKAAVEAVISDMHMPEMNGLEFVKKARGINNDIPYFILSGYSFNDEIDKALRGKVINKFFTKPFEKDEIKRNLF
ncbi:MAG: response regulator [Bacteroidota bacterium]